MKIAIKNFIVAYGHSAQRPPGEENEPAVRSIQAGDILEDDDRLVLKHPGMFAPYHPGELDGQQHD